jgi:hypothetical protein
MTEQPKQEERDAQGNEQKDDSWGKVEKFLRDNRTLSLSLLYLYTTGIGMIYTSVFYSRFGINLFDYSEPGDFLLAAIKKPIALLLVGFQVLLIGYLAIRDPHRRARVGFSIGFIFVCGFAVAVYSGYAGSNCVRNTECADFEHPAADVRYRSFSGSAGQVKEPDLRLIGATQRSSSSINTTSICL